MSMNLAHYLKDFSVPAVAPVLDGGMDLPDSEIHFPGLLLPEPVDVDRERREAYAEGHEAATGLLRAEMQAECMALEEAQAAALSALHEKHQSEMATAIAEGLRVVADRIALAVSEQAAAALAPFLSEEVAVKAAKDLAPLLRAEILGGALGEIVVAGPQKLFDILKAELPECAGRLRFEPADDLDLSVDIGDTVLVTRISAWTASLKKVLG